MISSQTAKEALKSIIWEDGKIEPVVAGPYRYQIVVHCSPRGRQKAAFSNGEFNYFGYVRCVNGKGEWTSRGSNVVPVLPDGRIIMVVEQRPIHGLYSELLPAKVEFENGTAFDLGDFGSLEFPGGAVEPGESITIGALRELWEETGTADQRAVLYQRLRPIAAFGSDIAGLNYYFVAYLSGISFDDYTPGDGGLNVLALTEAEVEKNIRSGVIASGQAALLSWPFYQEVKRARLDKRFLAELTASGYLKVEEVLIKR